MKNQPTTFKSRPLPHLLRATSIAGLLPALVLLLSIQPSRAGSATWLATPTNGDWFNAANWTAGGPPNGPADTATFDFSTTTRLSITANTEMDDIVFNAAASAFKIKVNPSFTLNLSGTGAVNNSINTQTFLATADNSGAFGTITFSNNAAASSGTLFIAQGRAIGTIFSAGTIYLNDASSAGNGAFINNGASGNAGYLEFSDTSTAGNATITTNGCPSAVGGGGLTQFANSSTAGYAIITTNGGGTSGAVGGLTQFLETSSAGNATFTNKCTAFAESRAGRTQFYDSATASNGTFINNGSAVNNGSGASTDFFLISTAGNGIFKNNGGLVSGAGGGITDFGLTFGGTPTADNGTFINNGGLVRGAHGGATQFYGSSTAGNATLIANGGVNGAEGGSIQFAGDSDGGTARMKLVGNGLLLISSHHSSVAVGSIEGSGQVLLGAEKLTVGTNNLSTVFSGTIQGLGVEGSLTKIGTARLALTQANTYGGGTFISGGSLLVKNATGSATGTGPVQVAAGTLGGTGAIGGAVTIASDSDMGFLAPGEPVTPGTLTIQNVLTFNSLATYKVDLDSTTAVADKVLANGVTINSGAAISIDDLGNGTLTSGTVLTVISNTAATAISGTFSNLADGSTFTVGSNTYQANYEGGDGNDLTLTVMQ